MKKLFSFVWSLLPLILCFVVYFGYCRVLPAPVKMVLFVLFAIAWFCRNLIASFVLKKISERTQLEAKHKKIISFLVKTAILVVFLGVPMLVYGVIACVSGLSESFMHACDTVIQDMSLHNGAGFFIFALFEVLITLGALVAIVFAFIKFRKNEWNIKQFAMIAGGAFLVQRIMSWFYFGSGVGGAIGEILFWAILFATIWAFKKFDILGKIRAWRKNRPIDAEYEEIDDSDDSDDIDPV